MQKFEGVLCITPRDKDCLRHMRSLQDLAMYLSAWCMILLGVKILECRKDIQKPSRQTKPSLEVLRIIIES